MSSSRFTRKDVRRILKALEGVIVEHEDGTCSYPEGVDDMSMARDIVAKSGPFEFTGNIESAFTNFRRDSFGKLRNGSRGGVDVIDLMLRVEAVENWLDNAHPKWREIGKG